MTLFKHNEIFYFETRDRYRLEQRHWNVCVRIVKHEFFLFNHGQWVRGKRKYKIKEQVLSLKNVNYVNTRFRIIFGSKL